MIAKMKKDIKKSSYYVWFLGAQEAKGLRGQEFMIPVIRYLIQREKETEPSKVTLQVSHKGLKIIQNVSSGIPVGKSGKNQIKNELVKHFIPHHAVTSVFQEEDIVSCILLLFNPVTKCPVHVHAYRCDSIETAEILCGQLQTLIERPENQKKLGDIESRLRAKGLIPTPQVNPLRKVQSPPSSSQGSSSTRESESSGGSSSSDRVSGFGSQDSRIANLYDSLAAELREKLNLGNTPKQAPILLPPRDYDTVHRQKGNLSGIDFRRCLNMNIVGMNASKKKSADIIANHTPGTKPLSAISRTKVGSSGGSSGIGSDHAPSPEQECEPRFLDNQSTSDEEWNVGHNEDSLFLVQTGNQNDWQPREIMSLPRARRHNSSGFDSSPVPSPGSPVMATGIDVYRKKSEDEKHSLQVGYDNPSKEKRYQKSVPSEKKQRKEAVERTPKSDLRLDLSLIKKRNPENRQRSPSPNEVISPRERFKDAKEKFLLLERERIEEQERRLKMNAEKKKAQYEMFAATNKTRQSWSRNSEEGDDGNPNNFNRRQPSLDDIRQSDELSLREKRRLLVKSQYHRNRSMESLNSDHSGNNHYRSNDRNSVSSSRLKLNNFQEEESNKMNRYRSIELTEQLNRSPVKGSSRPGSRSFSEDFLTDQVINERYRDVNRNNQSVPYVEQNIPLERYRSPTKIVDSSRILHKNFNHYPEETPVRRIKRTDSRYQSTNAMIEAQRTSIEELENEKRRNSNEVVKELKRRSYQDPRPSSELSYQGTGHHEIEDQHRHIGKGDINRNKVSKVNKIPTTTPSSSPRYRHSYAEPFHHHVPVANHRHDVLHRTNSSLSSGRVGIAAVHHY